VILVVEERLHDDVVAPGGDPHVADLLVADQPLGHGVQVGQLHRDADDGRNGHPHRPRGRHRDHVHQVLVDQPAVTAGATLRLPVNVEGALVALDDAHGAQGDGEITGVAEEIEAEGGDQ
jgi:acetamidase/formamidase